MSKITKENEVLIKAKVLDHLIEHLQKELMFKILI